MGTNRNSRHQVLMNELRNDPWKRATAGVTAAGVAMALLGIAVFPSSKPTERTLAADTTAPAEAAAGAASTPKAASTATPAVTATQPAAAPLQQASAAKETPAETFSGIVQGYCVVCHNGELKTASLELDKADIAHPNADAATWEKVVRKLRMGAMPPQGMPRPDKAIYQGLIDYLEKDLDEASEAHLNPGRPAVHRLNRTEYANAIHDLLDIDTSAVDIRGLLPTDDAGYGFDNIGDVLSVSPLLMEGYLSAARKVSRMAVGDRAASPAFDIYETSRSLIQNDRMSEDLPLGSRGGIAVKHSFPLDGGYTLRIKLQKNGYTYTLGTEHARQIDVRIDGERIKQFTVGGDYKGTRPSQPSSFGIGDYERYLINADQDLELRFQAKAGTHLLQVTFPNQTTEPEGIYQPPVTDYAYALSYGRQDMEPAIASLIVGGPYDAKGLGETPSRQKIFTCKPAARADEQACAKQIIGTLAKHAFRRPPTDADIQDLMLFYQAGRKDGSFEDGIQAALQRILVDPEFLFRIEKDPPGAAPATAYRLSDLELASRLSFFLWSSIPDDTLLDLSQQGKLSDPAVLEAQTRRMLADPKSSALLKNFAGQWLFLRNVEQAAPNPDFFPDFDGNLKDAFLKESELFFENQMREDHSILDILNANYTFVNERLAKHYGIPNVYGNRFRRVPLTDPNRQGVLGEGSILTVTSYATRTAPTIRGRWLLENILGVPPPPPPPNVPSLDLKRGDDGRVLTMRQQMEAHRANPVCASCHRVMDPLGFALENFDATGKWRNYDGGTAIDASGVAPDGFPLNGPADLRKYLSSHPDQFVNTVASKLLTYALGRGVEYYDAPALRKIMRDAEANDYRWSALILAIVKSTPFQMRRARES
jgi:cytochrome c5